MLLLIGIAFFLTTGIARGLLLLTQERTLICPVDKSGFFQLYSPEASLIASQLYSATAE